VHAGGDVVVNLHAIHAAVALAGIGVARNTIGRVMKRPPSSGQHLRIGNWASDMPEVRTTSWHGLWKRSWEEPAHLGQLGSIFSLPIRPSGMRISRNSTMRAAISSTESTSSAISILRSEA